MFKRMGQWVELATDKWVRTDDITAFWRDEQGSGNAVVMVGKEKVIITEISYSQFICFIKEEFVNV